MVNQHLDDDFVPITSGKPLSQDKLRTDFDTLGIKHSQSDLDLHLLRLLALHPHLRSKLGNQDLTQLSDAEKRTLLQDMNDLLGIKTLSRKQ